MKLHEIVLPVEYYEHAHGYLKQKYVENKVEAQRDKILYIKQQICNLFIFNRVSSLSSVNKSPVCAFHLVRVTIRMAFFCLINNCVRCEML